MLDYIKYFPISLGPRQSNQYLTPRGPNFTQSRQHTWKLNDCEFSLKVPGTKNLYGTERYSRKAKKQTPDSKTNIANLNLRNYSPSFMPSQEWNHSLFFTREWFFVGPWFSGERAKLLLFADIIGAASVDHFRGTSFFHPRVFESVIADWLSAYYGHHRNGKHPNFRGPKDWRPIPLSSSISGVMFDIHQIDSSKENPKINRYILFPISHDRFLSLNFDFFGLRKEEDFLDTKPIFELCDSIINSFRLTVGAKTLSDWNHVAKTCPNMALSETFGELKWPTSTSKINNQKVEKEITTNKAGLIENGRNG